ncbi:MAG: TonB-dependent receptor plug domain-containing protein [Endomicrobiaceae bacterium]|nr:TonB-dependent receptor plug domain-containing protein [Endomicrobiaceae bacterium]
MKEVKFLKCLVLVIFLLQSSLGAAFAQLTVFDLGEVVVSEDEIKQEDMSIEEKTKITQKTLKSHKVVDLAEILSDEMIEASMIRKSGYGNEVGLRGFTKSNLRFTLDNTLIEGSCGSRKDPPLSHINLLTVQKIEVKEGPYDVTVPGALGGDINIITKDAQKGFHGELLSKFGSYGYLSQGGYVTGGNDFSQVLLGYNYSRSSQYKDGDGNKLSSFNPSYNDAGKNMDAFNKNDFWGKISINTAKNQKMLISSSYGEANDIMTPRVAMDTEKEKTFLNKIEYSFKELSSFSEQLNLSAYYNRIEHYPYGEYRIGGVNNRRIEAISSITGIHIENKTLKETAVFTYGTDFYSRNWYGDIFDRTTGVIVNHELFPDVNELNFGLYAKTEKDIGKLSITAGLRMDIFHSQAEENLKFSKTITDTNSQTDFLPSANIFLKYFLTDDSNIFGGLGLTGRTPTTVERYVQESNTYYGNPDLKPSYNFETDLGFETKIVESLKIKTKGFFSYLPDYIYQQYNGGVRTYTNIDAYIFGGDMTASYDLSKYFMLEFGLAYQRGQKLTYPKGNNDNNLAEICPLKNKLALSYDKNGFFAIYEWLHSLDSKDIDRDAGETTLKGWDVFNLRLGYQFKEKEGKKSILDGLSLNFGIDNILDKEYTMANSYEYDPTDTSGTNVKIVNEPGRFIYGSLSYQF